MDEELIRKIVREELEKMLKEGLKIGDNTIYITPTQIDMGGGRIVNLGAPVNDNDAVRKIDLQGVVGKVLLAFDDTELSTTSTSYTSLKNFRFVKNSDYGLGWKKLYVHAEARQATSGQTTYVGIYVDDVLKAEITYTETSYTLKSTVVDISDLADGIRSFDARVKVTGGTGYLKLLEVYGEC